MNKCLNAKKKLKKILKNKDNYFRYTHQVATQMDYEPKTVEFTLV